jgi:hypothetical protein
VSDGSLRSLRGSLGSRRLRRIRRNDCLGRSALSRRVRRFLLQIGGANIAPRGSRFVSRLVRRHSGTKSMSHRSSSLRRRAIRVRLLHSLALAPRGSRFVSRLVRRHSGTKSMSPRSSSLQRRAIRVPGRSPDRKGTAFQTGFAGMTVRMPPDRGNIPRCAGGWRCTRRAPDVPREQSWYSWHPNSS